MFDFFNANIAIAMVALTAPFAFYGQIMKLVHGCVPNATMNQAICGVLIATGICAIGFIILFFVDWKLVLISILGAVILNLIILLNHKNSRYVA